MAEANRVHSTPRRTASSPDPILKLIAVADRRLAEYEEAKKVASELATGLSEDDARGPGVRLPPELQSSITFGSEEFLKQVCGDTGKRLKQRIKELRGDLRDSSQSPTMSETMVHLEADKKLLAMLPSAEKTALTKLRKERARVHKIWRATGYGTAYRRLNRARWQFETATFHVKNSEPTTVQGAIAVVKYAAERGNLASRSIPWSYFDFQSVSYLLDDAHKILVKKAA
jgi:hypothetical protein